MQYECANLSLKVYLIAIHNKKFFNVIKKCETTILFTQLKKLTSSIS